MPWNDTDDFIVLIHLDFIDIIVRAQDEERDLCTPVHEHAQALKLCSKLLIHAEKKKQFLWLVD